MNMNTILLASLVAALFVAHVSCGKNSGGYQPQFDYQWDVLKKLMELEAESEKIKEAFGAGQGRIGDLVNQLEDNYAILSQLNETATILQAQEGGSTYIRWGRSTCEGDAQIVYKGLVAGSHHSHPGGGTNYLCLTKEPKWKVYNDGAESNRGLIYGVEYEILGDDDDQDAPCVVCSIPRSNVLMTPGTNVCEDGWKLEYWGYIASQAYNQNSKEFVCLDEDPEYMESGDSNQDGGLFYHVEGRSGSLACPPYVNGRELTCAVCSFANTQG